jgi:hypothetical protein
MASGINRLYETTIVQSNIDTVAADLTTEISNRQTAITNVQSQLDTLNADSSTAGSVAKIDADNRAWTTQQITSATLGLGTMHFVDDVAGKDALTGLTVGDVIRIADPDGDGVGAWMVYYVTAVEEGGAGNTATLEPYYSKDQFNQNQTFGAPIDVMPTSPTDEEMLTAKAVKDYIDGQERHVVNNEVHTVDVNGNMSLSFKPVTESITDTKAEVIMNQVLIDGQITYDIVEVFISATSDVTNGVVLNSGNNTDYIGKEARVSYQYKTSEQV